MTLEELDKLEEMDKLRREADAEEKENRKKDLHNDNCDMTDIQPYDNAAWLRYVKAIRQLTGLSERVNKKKA